MSFSYPNKRELVLNRISLEINKDIADGYKKLGDLEKELTDLRIRVAEIASPGHPGRQPYYSEREN